MYINIYIYIYKYYSYDLYILKIKYILRAIICFTYIWQCTFWFFVGNPISFQRI